VRDLRGNSPLDLSFEGAYEFIVIRRVLRIECFIKHIALPRAEAVANCERGVVIFFLFVLMLEDDFLDGPP